MSKPSASPPWLLLIHQLPPKPDYFRVKIWRRLQSLGAVSLKNSVYVLPNADQAREDFQWLQKEIEGAGGEAALCEAHFVGGLADDAVRALFNAARDGDYQTVAQEVREALAGIAAEPPRHDELRARYSRLQKRFDQTAAIDFFESPQRAATAALLAALNTELSRRERPKAATAGQQEATFVGRIWATRRNPGVDRMASAWLIRRFIDPAARLVFIDEDDAPVPEQLRFDMAVAEFTHEGDRCTFEVLLDRFQLTDKALVAIAQVIHDLDLKDKKFQPDAAAGIGYVLAGIAAAELKDEERVRQASAVFDALHRAWSSTE